MLQVALFIEHLIGDSHSPPLLGNIYIADTVNNRVRKVTVTTGAPRYFFASHHTLTHSLIALLHHCSVTPTSQPTVVPRYSYPTLNIPPIHSLLSYSATPTYYPSLSPHSISVISTIAGTGTGSYSGDNGQATSATVNSPHGIDIDSSWNVYISDYSNHRVRKITASTGIITTYAGTGSGGYSGDGGVASSAALNGPNGLGIDSAGTDSADPRSYLVSILIFLLPR